MLPLLLPWGLGHLSICGSELRILGYAPQYDNEANERASYLELQGSYNQAIAWYIGSMIYDHMVHDRMVWYSMV